MLETQVDVDERIFGQRRRAVQAHLQWHKTLALIIGLLCKPFPKTEEPWRARTGLEKRGRGGMIVH